MPKMCMLRNDSMAITPNCSAYSPQEARQQGDPKDAGGVRIQIPVIGPQRAVLDPDKAPRHTRERPMVFWG